MSKRIVPLKKERPKVKFSSLHKFPHKAPHKAPHKSPHKAPYKASHKSLHKAPHKFQRHQRHLKK